MAQLVNIKTGQFENIPDTQVVDALQSGGYSFQKDTMVPVITPDGDGYLPSSEAIRALTTPGSGFSYLGEEQKNAIQLERQYGTPIEQTKTVLEGLARGATVGLSDIAGVATGIIDPEAASNRREVNTGLSVTSDIVGSIAPIIASGGTGAVARATSFLGTPIRTLDAAGRAAQRATQKTLQGVITGRLAPAVPLGARGIVEGAGFGAGMYLSDVSLGNEKYNAEALTTRIAMGAGFGALAFPVLGIGAEQTARAVSKSMSAATIGLKKFAGISDGVVTKIDTNPSQFKLETTPIGKGIFAIPDDTNPNRFIYKDGSKMANIDINGYVKSAGKPILSQYDITGLRKLGDDMGMPFMPETVVLERGSGSLIDDIYAYAAKHYTRAEKANTGIIDRIQTKARKQLSGLQRLSKEIQTLKGSVERGNAKDRARLTKKISKYNEQMKGYRKTKNELKAQGQKMVKFADDKSRIANIDRYIRENFSGYESRGHAVLFNPKALAGNFEAFSLKATKSTQQLFGDQQALKMLGLTKSQFTKYDPLKLKRMAQFIRDNWGNKDDRGIVGGFKRTYFDVSDLEGIAQQKQVQAWAKIDGSIEEAVNYLSAARLTTGVTPREIIQKIIEKGKKEGTTPTGVELPDYQSISRFFKKEVDAIRRTEQKMQSEGRSVFTPRELYDLRKGYDSLIKYKPGKDMTNAEVAAYAMRTILDESLQESMTRFGDRRGREITRLYRQGKDEYGVAKEVGNLIRSAIGGEMSRSNVGFGGWVMGAGAAGAAGAIGVAAGGPVLGITAAAGASLSGVVAKNFLQGPGRTLNLLYANEVLKSAVDFTSRLERAAKSFVAKSSNSNFVGAKTFTKAFTLSDWKETNEKMAKGEFDNFTQNQSFLNNNAGLLEQYPRHGYYLQETIMRGNDFLYSKFPKSNYDSVFGSTYAPTPAELSKFSRYYNAVTNPLSIIDEFATGDVSVETIEATKNVFPTIYQALKIATLEETIGKEINYRQKQQFKKVFNINSASFQDGSGMQVVQLINQQAQPQEEQGQQQIQRPSGADRIDRASESMTTTQQLMAR